VTILTRPEIGGEQPSYGPQLDDNEVAAVLTYIRKLLDGAAKRIMCEQVLKVRLDTARRPDYSTAWASDAPW
jgi:mono/diheme cytochrome c family protein